MKDKISNLTAESIKKLLLDVYVRYRRNEINDKQAKQEADILANMLKAIEITDIQKQNEELKALLCSR